MITESPSANDHDIRVVCGMIPDFDGDVTMPAIPDDEWEEVAREDRAEDGKYPALSFVTLRRRT